MNRARQTVAATAFFALFPGFFFWHFAYALGVHGLNIGLWAQIAPVMAVLAVSLYLRPLFSATRHPFGAIVVVLIAWAGVITAYQALAGAEWSAVYLSTSVVVIWIALFVIGVFLPLGEQRNVFSIVAAAAWLIMGLLIMAYLDGLSFDPREMLPIMEIRRSAAHYQGYTQAFAVTSIVVIATVKQSVLRWFIAMVSIGMTFFLLGRADFLGLIVGIVIAELTHAVALRRWRLILVASMLVGVVASAVFAAHQLGMLPYTRHIEIFNLTRSTSWVARTEMLRSAIGDIAANPLFGNFNGPATRGGAGTYAHNALSAWAAYGAVGFILYVSVVVWAAVASVRLMLTRQSPATYAAVALNALSLLLVLTAKAVFWPLPALGWGLLAAHMYSARKVEAAS